MQVAWFLTTRTALNTMESSFSLWWQDNLSRDCTLRYRRGLNCKVVVAFCDPSVPELHIFYIGNIGLYLILRYCSKDFSVNEYSFSSNTNSTRSPTTVVFSQIGIIPYFYEKKS
jgi:hypothetical protein